MLRFRSDPIHDQVLQVSKVPKRATPRGQLYNEADAELASSAHLPEDLADDAQLRDRLGKEFKRRETRGQCQATLHIVQRDAHYLLNSSQVI